MFKGLFKGILSAFIVPVMEDYRRLSIQLLRIETAKVYLQGVRMARVSAIGLMQMGLVIGLICIGAVLFHVGLFILLPWSVEAKAALGMCLGLAYVVGGGLLLRAAMNERSWMEKSGANDMMKTVIGGSNHENKTS